MLYPGQKAGCPNLFAHFIFPDGRNKFQEFPLEASEPASLIQKFFVIAPFIEMRGILHQIIEHIPNPPAANRSSLGAVRSE